MRLRGMAKINLGLDVVRKREDGYHEVRMIMQTIRMYDQIDLEISEKPGIYVQTNLPFLPCDENNLTYRAAKLLMDEFGIRQGISIDLKKFIPVAAGMAGGSTDAAAVMVGINRLFRLGLTRRELMRRGVKIGADVPYCIMRGTALAEGIGEVLTPLPPMPSCHLLIGKPAVNVSTKFVYTSLRADKIRRHPDIGGMAQAIREGDLFGIVSRMDNVLERVTIPEYPVIGEIKRHMKKHGALGALMSGSGPTVFGVFDDGEKAKRAAAELRKSRLARQVFLTVPFQNGGTMDDK